MTRATRESIFGVVVLFLDLLLDSWCSFSPKGSRGFASSSLPAFAVCKYTNFSVRDFISARIGSALRFPQGKVPCGIPQGHRQFSLWDFFPQGTFCKKSHSMVVAAGVFNAAGVNL